MPAEIRSFATGSMSHNRVCNLAEHIAGVITKNHENEDCLSTIAFELKVHGCAIGTALERESCNDLMEDIRHAESTRDDLVKALFTGIKFSKKHFSQERRENASTLSSILKKQMSRIHLASDVLELKHVNSLLSNLADSKVSQMLTVLDLAEYPALIDEENSRFLNLTSRRAEIKSEKGLSLIRPTRVLLNQSLRAMKECLTLLNRTAPTKYEATVEEINQHITEVVDLAKAEKSTPVAE